MFLDRMVTTAIPERIFALCKCVEKKNVISDKDLFELMEPAFLRKTTTYFGEYRKAAEELGLISISDNMISLGVDKKIISTMDSMRLFINSKLEEFSEGHFYKVTKAYFDLGSDIFKQGNNVADMTDIISEKSGETIDAKEMRAWRFWVSFLGFGYLQEMFFIPNAKIFLWDLIQNANFEKDKIYDINEFITKLNNTGNIVIGSGSDHRLFNYGVSNGLRSLEKDNYIKLDDILDHGNKWNLYPMEIYNGHGTVSNITILKGAK